MQMPLPIDEAEYGSRPALDLSPLSSLTALDTLCLDTHVWCPRLALDFSALTGLTKLTELATRCFDGDAVVRCGAAAPGLKVCAAPP